MLERDIGEVGYRYADIFPYTVRLLSIAHSRQSSESPPRIFPQSFDEIYSLRDRLAAFQVSIGRKPVENDGYYAYLESSGSADLVIIKKHFDGAMPKEKDRRFAIVPNDYPAEMPMGAQHQLMWYLDEELNYSWVADKIANHIINLKLTVQDFVVYRKPSNSGLFLPGFSRSINIPHVHLIIRDRDSDSVYNSASYITSSGD
jgi:hypothetical protein